MKPGLTALALAAASGLVLAQDKGETEVHGWTRIHPETKAAAC